MEVVEAIQQALEDGRLTREGRPAQVRQIYRVPLPGPRVRGKLLGGGAAPEAQAREAAVEGAQAGGDAPEPSRPSTTGSRCRLWPARCRIAVRSSAG